MNETGIDRRLAAILAADVAGYSRLMAADEEATLNVLKSLRDEVIDPAIAAHGGRIFKTTGDGLLAEFPSVVEAVRGAVDIQRTLARRTAEQPPDRRLQFRIGINLGDVIHEDDDIYGDGVNLAARLEEIADIGGIAVSAAVYDQVRTRLEVGAEDLGFRPIKNRTEPLRVYRLLPDTAAAAPGPVRAGRRFGRGPAAAVIAVAAAAVVAGTLWWAVSGRAPPPSPPRPVASVAKMAYPLPDKPSIAVLPFDNLSGDPAQAHLGDGIAENIIASLAKTSKMFVIARNSAFSYRGQQATTQQIAEEMGVRYVLTGGIQRAGDTLRITTQLVDALSGFTLWSERYDREAKDVFALQDEITLNVLSALQVTLTEGEMSRIRRRGTQNLEAWLLVNQSIELFQRLNREDNARARELAERAVRLDPGYPDAYVRLARAHLTDFQAGWVADRTAAFKRSVELTQKALALDDGYPDVYNLLGAIHLFVNRHDDALAYARKSVELGPNYAIAKASLGMVQNYAGEAETAITTIRDAMRLSPYYPGWFLKELGRAYILTGRNEEAIAALSQRLKRDPDSGEGRLLLAAAYGAAGLEEEARGVMQTFLESRPRYTVRHYARGEFFRNPADLERVLAGLRKAGLPE